MSRNWRISSLSGVLLAAYFIPTWGTIAWRIVTSPVRGLFERPSVSIALYATDHLQLPTEEAVRYAWLLALGRLTVVAFLALFVVLTLLSLVRRKSSGSEALTIALVIGSLISFASMWMASQVGEIEALRLHATELLLMVGTGIVMLFDYPVQQTKGATEQAGELPMEFSLATPAGDQAQL